MQVQFNNMETYLKTLQKQTEHEADKVKTLEGKVEEKNKMIEDLQQELDILKEEKAPKEESSEKKKNDIKSFNHKDVPKPEKYDCDIKDFNSWHDLFGATLINLDDQWEQVLDMSQVASSFGGSDSEEIPSPGSKTSNSHLNNSSDERNISEDMSSIEVLTDASTDFFNSSRVNLLITPERNKDKRTEIIMTRNDVCVQDTNKLGI